MTDLKQLTVRALRELARKHLGAGYSRLKTKAELVAALSKVMGPEKAAAPAAAKAPAKATPAKPEPKAPAKVEAKPEPKAEPKPEPKPVAKVEPKAKVEAKPKVEPKPKAAGKSKLDEIAAKYIERPAAPAPAPAPSAPAPKPAAAALANPLEIAHPAPASPKAPGGGAPEPTPLAKPPAPTAAKLAAKKPALPREDDDQLEAPSEEDAEALEAAEEAEASKETEESEEAEVEAAPKPRRISPEEQALIDENLGELPFSYGDDTVNIQARDPSTLWVYWDLSVSAWQQAQGIRSSARPVLRLYEANQLVREVEIALEAKSWYLYNIESGRRYRAEIDLVRGREVLHRLGPVSNTIQVPNEGPSSVIDDRFITIPWEVPVQRAHDLVNKPHTGEPFPPAQAQALLQRAEQALRDESKPAAPTPAAGPGETVTERPVEGQGPQGERFVEVSVTRKLGASDTLTETFRRRLAGASEQVEANPRTRFGGRWTSSRPA